MKKDFIAMKKNLCYVALAFMAMVSCTSNDYVGDQEKLEAGISRPISFGFDVPTPTRAAGTEAATALGNQFIVYGEKGEITNAAPVEGNYVFPNYQVNYINNSSYTTTSNTKGWEYVGYTHSENYQNNITTKKTSEAAAVPAHGSTQTIKFWDYGAANYVFTAVSALGADIEAGRVKIQKNEYGETAYDKGYTITLAKSGSDSYVYPTVNKLFFADRNVITQSTNSDRSQVNLYGGNVTFNFRNLVSHIRAGIYETIPGYDISEIKFYVNTSGATPEQTLVAKVSETSAFGAVCPNISTTNYEGIITVTYYSNTENENQPKVTAKGSTPATNLILGTNISTITTTKLLGTTAASPTWDTDGGAFTEVFPQIENNINLKLKCDYTLWNSVTHETIKVTGATAEVPAIYLQWKPNYKYTYLFKISDNTNGQTGTTGPAGLYPITFDAVEIAADDGKVEYITTVSEPSITTFGAVYNTTSTKYTSYQTGQNEYLAQTSPNQLDIFATFMEGSTVKTPTVDGTSGAQHVNVFKVTATDASLITEASVAEAIANPAMTVDIYKKTGENTYEKVTDATTITAGTTYYKADNTSKAPGAAGYTETSAVAGTDYKVGAKINVTNITTDASTNFSAAPAAVTSVPGEDGVDKTIDAVKLTGVKAGTYAIEYEASSAWTGTYKKVYKVIVVQ